MKKFILTITAALLAFAGVSRADEYPDISIGDVKKAIAEKKIALIDVNGSDSWTEGHIPGAIDFEASKEKLADLLPKDKASLVVAYCGGPSCSAYKSGAKLATKLGYTNVKHLSAGISGWKSAGEKTEKGDAKKTAATEAAPHTYVATFTGVTCSACKAHVSAAIAKLPGGSNATFAVGEKEGTQKVTFTASCDKVCKDKLVEALGDGAKTYVVQDLAMSK
jgi:rhodanese-related sulfurtransferase/copper chaperone CopZ